MKTRNKQPLSIYIHIPFCKRKCLYCDFLSAPACAQERESYVEALLREISFMAEYCREYEVISVFFGGGTPSLLSGEQMQRIMSVIRADYKLRADAEISMECNPATASFETLKEYRNCGINRLSIGLQSANNEELKALGRIHDYAQFVQTYEDARRAGFTNINIDLMSALPGQTLDSYEETLQKVLALKPEHISAYSLIIEEGTPFYEKYGKEETKKCGVEDGEERSASIHSGDPVLPDEDTERLMYYRTNELLQEKGYERYEISNFAKEGYECRHNLTYWTGIDYIGFGIGSASYFQGYRYKNTVDIQKYKEKMMCITLENARTALQSEKVFSCPSPLESDEGSYCDSLFTPEKFLWYEEIQQLSMEEKMEEFMFLGLRLKNGIRERDFYLQFGRTVWEVYPEVLERLSKEGVLIQKDYRIYLSEKGTDVANYAMAQFLLD